MSAPKAEKRRAWMAGHERQISAWIDIAAMGNGKDQKAAQWALDSLANE